MSIRVLTKKNHLKEDGRRSIKSSNNQHEIRDIQVTPLTSEQSSIMEEHSAIVCDVPELRQENMTSCQLSQYCFTEEEVLCPDDASKIPTDTEERQPTNYADATTQQITRDEWQKHKKIMLTQNEARSGRDTQRYEINLQSNEKIRLNAGCVPIMRDGKILLISSRKKPEWILPKGGWEIDESVEESAMRESYEEGGILGIIGPQLQTTEFEARKAKMKRLEREMSEREMSMKQNNPILQWKHNLVRSVSRTSSTASSSSGKKEIPQATCIHAIRRPFLCFFQYMKCFNIFRKVEQRKSDTKDNSNDPSDPSSIPCTHVRLSMFPMYVLEVQDKWPERGRARKIVDIDTAINIMSLRPEFQSVLLEVKQMGYHLEVHSKHTR